MTDVEYIDILIASEKSEHRPGMFVIRLNLGPVDIVRLKVDFVFSF